MSKFRKKTSQLGWLRPRGMQYQPIVPEVIAPVVITPPVIIPPPLIVAEQPVFVKGQLASVRWIGFTPEKFARGCAFLRQRPELITNANLNKLLDDNGLSLKEICKLLPPKTEEKVQGLVVWFRRNPTKLTPIGLRIFLEVLHISFGGPQDPAAADPNYPNDWWPRPYEMVETLFPVSESGPIAWYCIYWWERIFRCTPLQHLPDLKPTFNNFLGCYKEAEVLKGYSEENSHNIWGNLMKVAWKYGVPPVWYNGNEFERFSTMQEWIKVPQPWKLGVLTFPGDYEIFRLPLEKTFGVSIAGWSSAFPNASFEMTI